MVGTKYLYFPNKNKKAATEVTAKNANSDSRQTNKCEMGANAHTYKHLEFAFLSNSKAFIDITKISVIIPKKEKYTQFHTVFS